MTAEFIGRGGAAGQDAAGAGGGRMRMRVQGAGGGFPVSAGTVLLAIAGVVMLATAVLVLIWSLIGAEARLLEAEGQEALAQVTDHRIVETRERDHDGRVSTSTSYYVTLAFAPAGGAPVTVEHSVSRDRYEALKTGDEVALIYAASDPGVIEFARGDRAGEAVALGWVSVVTGAVSLVLGGIGMVLLRRREG